ncbi:MAG: hypothetical protein ABL923_12540, partial [Burkholderiaceae bacterium]
PYENPFLNKKFIVNGETITLGFLFNYYAQSWTEEEKDEIWRWEEFTHNKLGVRVKVHMGKFMNELVNIRDNFFMLHYYIGKVTYQEKSYIENWINNSQYTDFLDSLGQRSILSLTVLRNHFSDEKEIRILYSYTPPDYGNDNDFVRNNVRVIGPLCKQPFNWRGIVEEVLVDMRMNDDEMSQIKTKLENAGVYCPVNRSLAS